ncbi:hypothetical protein FDJ57_gp79 [Gordonia phage Sour]|uniref:Uncharacterized protein n=1 Tax=Gordonia phage Sour TaxID=2182349 RepID=A0A2U8UKZ3_9CAUD|nr:hypothetical protein FDJ57_gp79 [Gordonia phage Sour]AWN04280.1 hypothetical protein PBI_SOUR_79 [Gordonia phage Sour]
MTQTFETPAIDDAALNRYIDQFILMDTRIAVGHAETLEEWERWHAARAHAGIMAATLELSDPSIKRYSDVLGRPE